MLWMQLADLLYSPRLCLQTLEIPTHHTVHIFQSGLGLPDEAYYREDNHKPVVEKYTAMVAQLLLLAGYVKDEKQGLRSARKFVDIERSIASHHWDVVASRDSDKTYNPRTFDEFAAALNSFNLEAWVDAWQESYNNSEASHAQPFVITFCTISCYCVSAKLY